MVAAPNWNETSLWEIFDLTAVAGADIGGFLSITLAKCASWFQASGGSIFLKGDDGVFRVSSRVGTQKEMPDSAEIVAGVGIGGIVVETKRGKLIHDPLADPDLAGVIAKRDIGSSIVVPLVSSQWEVIGVLNLSRRVGEGAFRKADLEQAEAMGAFVALAVADARMVGELQDQIERTQKANEKVLAVLDSVSAAVVVVDADGEVVNHNDEAEQDSFLGGESGEGITELKTVLNRVREGVLDSGEEKGERAYDSGSDRAWLVQGVPMISGGAVLTVQEITGPERQQRELARVRRMAEIGQMTAQIAHEIRNPLTGIRSAAQMIGEDPSLAEEFIGMIQEETVKLNALCDDFLEFARPMELELEAVCLGDVVDRSVALVRSDYEEKGVKLLVVGGDGLPTISMDARRIGQVILNLLRNALQATESGQAVKVSVERCKVVVEDEGVGMSEEHLGKLFSPFFTTKSDGTGLGLVHSRKVVESHGGEIKVDSELGRGSRFEVVLEGGLS